LIATLLLVFHFESSDRLANAYGIAVSLTMVITTLLASVVVHFVWRWKLWQSALVVITFLVVDLAFLGANLTKLLHGGLLPLFIGIAGYLMMISWRRGRAMLSQKLFGTQKPLRDFVHELEPGRVARVPGTGVFLCANPGATPPALIHHLKHNKTLLSQVVI